MDQSGFDKIIKEYRQALLWCKANPDFSPTPENEIVKEGKIETVEMMKSEEEKDPNYVDEFHDSLKKPHPTHSDVESMGRLSKKIEEDVLKMRGHPRFHELVKQMSELHSKKNHDYAGEEKPLNNLREVEGMGIPAWVGVGVRISDKYTRMKNFIKNRKFEFKEESFKDTMMDMAVYAVLCIILFQESPEQRAKAKKHIEYRIETIRKDAIKLCSVCKRPMFLDGEKGEYVCTSLTHPRKTK